MRTFVLDTGIVVHYLRQSPLYSKIEADHNLTAVDAAPVISSVTKGELLSFAQQRGWGTNKMQFLSVFLQNIITVDIKAADNDLQLTYAQIDAYSKNKSTDLSGNVLIGSARNMGKNDLWIAATACVLKAPLLTIDGDFDHLNTTFMNVIKYLP